MKNNRYKALCIGITAVSATLLGNAVFAASFDCAKAATTVEKAICADVSLSSLDSQLATLYQRTVATNPQVREGQRNWLQEVRNQCSDAACLRSAYEVRIAALDDSVKQATQQTIDSGHSQVRNIVPADDPIALFMDVKYFYGQSELARENLWTNLNGEVFKKKVIEWTERDFELLAQKLKEQIAIERNEAEARQAKVRNMGYKPTPVEDDYDYKFRKDVLEKTITSIPKYVYLVNQTRNSVAAATAQKEAQERQRQELEAEKEKQRIAEAERRQLEMQKRQEEQSRSRNLLILGLIVAAILSGWIWHKFIRLRCPKCKSTDVETVEVTETDRWRGTKKVSEKNSRGTNTRHVSTTYVKNQYEYGCRDCGKNWLTLKKEEL